MLATTGATHAGTVATTYTAVKGRFAVAGDSSVSPPMTLGILQLAQATCSAAIISGKITQQTTPSALVDWSSTLGQAGNG